MKAFIALLILLLAEAAQAQVRSLDKVQLVDVLSSRPPCCVIDGRAADRRQKEPLADALPWRSNLTIKPTATVVVIADRDQDALAIAKVLEKRHPGKPIIAVKGGLATWKSASLALLAAAGMDAANSAPLGFVIPSNTCEHGKPLQELRFDKKK